MNHAPLNGIPVVLVQIDDCLRALRRMPPNSVHCCVTSPPYFGLRDYGQDGQIGLEETPEAFVTKLVEVFREVRRVLRDDGTLWLNLGDSYNAYNGNRDRGCGANSRHHEIMPSLPSGSGLAVPSLKTKDLIGIPWMVAFALRADGWYLRQDIIWHKPNPMPESVTDRCTKAHEYIFLLSKSPRYFFDNQAIKEAAVGGASGNTSRKQRPGADTLRLGAQAGAVPWAGGESRNRRDVWTVTTKPFKGAHFATFPPDLIEPCVLAGSPKQVCGLCGSPHVPVRGRLCPDCQTLIPTQHKQCPNCRRVNDWKADRFDPTSEEGSSFGATDYSTPGNGTPRKTGSMGSSKTIVSGYAPSCSCNHPTSPAIVLDPFGGSGTTAGVAVKHGRNATLCELNVEYALLVQRRIDEIAQQPFNLTCIEH